jgi:hypothetical protein
VAWLPPEPEIGEEPELKPLEPELELELDEPELVPDEPELVPDEPEPAEVEPELAEEFEEPAEAELVVWAEPGKAKASAPAVATLATVTTVVVDRTLARPRSLAAWARRIPSSRRALMFLIMRSGTRYSLYGTSPEAMSGLLLRPLGLEATQAA